MKEVNYIPGDLVMTDGFPIGTKKGVAYIVTASDPNRILTLESGEVLKGTATLDNVEGTKITDNGYLFCDCAAWVKHIVPIKLTPAILEDNGWILARQGIDDEKFEYFEYEKGYEYPVLTFYPCKGGQNMSLSVYIKERLIVDFIQYCHQLQHLLFGLGLNSELKV